MLNSITTNLLTRRSLLRRAALAPACYWQFSRVQAAAENTRLVLLGTQGGPNYNLKRGETASMVLVGDEPYLIDCGYGTLRALIESGIAYLTVGTIFLTHLHDDHNADLPALLSHQWTQGRITPTRIYGPQGTDQLVHAANLYNQANTDIRLIDEARTVQPADLFAGVVVPAQAEPVIVMDDGKLKVTAVENSHFPEAAKAQMPHRALSYRFDTADRSIVFSGDTAWSDNLVNLAQGADVLVCEAIQVDAFRQSFDRMVASGNYADNPEGIWAHIVGTHTSTLEAGRMAAAAGVRTLVLNHIIPGGLGDLDDAAYIASARVHFAGEIIVGRDQLVL
jgi:ribonuclease BN (tRNA processing enzyme)